MSNTTLKVGIAASVWYSALLMNPQNPILPEESLNARKRAS